MPFACLALLVRQEYLYGPGYQDIAYELSSILKRARTSPRASTAPPNGYEFNRKNALISTSLCVIENPFLGFCVGLGRRNWEDYFLKAVIFIAEERGTSKSNTRATFNARRFVPALPHYDSCQIEIDHR
ncbi:hypothetical protein R3P38DRAFT_2763329 [Favolaschia claudopus]|uniref:Uncharacterized protein n=1 Tax=Favolaschia claudopus TaxID=2862362 RepID=A0AAW0DH58_9AGAR